MQGSLFSSIAHINTDVFECKYVEAMNGIAGRRTNPSQGKLFVVLEPVFTT